MSEVRGITGTWSNPARRRCEGKIAYGTSKKATARAQSASAKTGQLIIAYDCPDCGRIHIGHADISQQIVREKGKK